LLKEESMRKVFMQGAVAAGLIAAMGLSGCDKKPAAPKDGKEPAKTTSVEPKSEEEQIAAAIAELPEAERAVAVAQKTCPVGDAPLGSMGMPYKVTVKGHDVYLCCEGCKGALEKDPDKYLAKLDEKK
jgi:YHS domain-containing protein